jgi:glycopeptide antibiotics resistance protein
MGILIPIFMERKVGILYIGGASFLLSFFIETVQLVFKIGVFDVDDLIMNTLGGLIGYVIYRISQENYRRYLRRQIRKRKNNRKKGRIC